MSNVLLDHTLTYFEANKLKMVLLDLVGIVRFLFYPKGTFQLLLLQFQISNLALSPLFLFLDFLGFVIFRTVRILLKSSRKYTLFPTRRLMTYILSAVHFHQRIRTKAQEHNTSQCLKCRLQKQLLYLNHQHWYSWLELKIRSQLTLLRHSPSCSDPRKLILYFHCIGLENLGNAALHFRA